MQTAQLVERAFHAMGSEAHLLVLSTQETADDLLDLAREEISRLEQRWSRFLPLSEVSRANASSGRPVAVSPETFELVSVALVARNLTAGRFDPLVLPAVEQAGYDRDFDQIQMRGVDGLGARPRRSARTVTVDPPFDCALDARERTITVPIGRGLDLGGIGKGRAADLVSSSLIEAGADGVCVNLGGDLRVRGRGPEPDGWVIGVEDPFDPDTDLTVLRLDGAASATSSRVKRCWHANGEQQHHLIDPRTGRPADTDLAAVTVIASSATWAEVIAKAALLAGSTGATVVIDEFGAAGLAVDLDGKVMRAGTIWEYEL
ncbi:MAG: FAD:protein FMN transferase [Acidimicrobiales bacterium]|nr:FAD:protein FMN transferase [Acidimicrobiales bacterium]